MVPAAAAPGDVVERWFRYLDSDKDGMIGGAQAVDFFRRSNLSDDTLREVWRQSAGNMSLMSLQQFRTAMKLVALAQQNGGSFTPNLAQDVVLGLGSPGLALPKVRGFSMEEWMPANPFARYEDSSGGTQGTLAAHLSISMQSTSTRASSSLASPRDTVVSPTAGVVGPVPQPVNSPPPPPTPPQIPVDLPSSLPVPRPNHANVASPDFTRLQGQESRQSASGQDKSKKLSLRKTLIGLTKKKPDKEEVVVMCANLNGPGANLQNFTASDIRKATNNFENHLGGGGYGEVYSGSINHVPVAVKVLGQNVMQGSQEYMREITFLGRIRHPHIVTLYGKCDTDNSLVYELLDGGNLEEKMESGTLPWEARLRIAKEVALGLFYLHNCSPPIVHRDMKPANVLLDGCLKAKVGDMGLARTMDTSVGDSIAVGGIKGTFHYIAPEYQNSGVATTLCDVYSFGIILLQLLTNRPVNTVREEVREALHGGTALELVDSRPGVGDWPSDIVQSAMQLGCKCCQRQSVHRPQMADVVNDLKEIHESAVAMAIGDSIDGTQLDKILKCPLTGNPLRDPVIADDGHTYERENVQRWFDSGYRKSPLTNLPMTTRLIPNHMAKSILAVRRGSG